MRFFKRKKRIRKPAPEEVERACRRMRMERELERRKTHWLCLRLNWPEI